jgi:hypothetical protein
MLQDSIQIVLTELINDAPFASFNMEIETAFPEKPLSSLSKSSYLSKNKNKANNFFDLDSCSQNKIISDFENLREIFYKDMVSFRKNGVTHRAIFYLLNLKLFNALIKKTRTGDCIALCMALCYRLLALILNKKINKLELVSTGLKDGMHRHVYIIVNRQSSGLNLYEDFGENSCIIDPWRKTFFASRKRFLFDERFIPIDNQKQFSSKELKLFLDIPCISLPDLIPILKTCQWPVSQEHLKYYQKHKTTIYDNDTSHFYLEGNLLKFNPFSSLYTAQFF